MVLGLSIGAHRKEEGKAGQMLLPDYPNARNGSRIELFPISPDPFSRFLIQICNCRSIDVAKAIASIRFSPVSRFIGQLG